MGNRVSWAAAAAPNSLSRGGCCASCTPQAPLNRVRCQIQFDITGLSGQRVETLQTTVSGLLCMQGDEYANFTLLAARTATVPLADGLWDWEGLAVIAQLELIALFMSACCMIPLVLIKTAGSWLKGFEGVAA